MMQRMVRIAYRFAVGLIPTLSRRDNIIESRCKRGNARIPTSGEALRRGLARTIIPSLSAAMLMRWRRSNAHGRILTSFGSFRIRRFECWAQARASPA